MSVPSERLIILSNKLTVDKLGVDMNNLFWEIGCEIYLFHSKALLFCLLSIPSVCFVFIL